MNRSAAASLVIGIVILALSVVLPYIGDRHFIWFTINGDSALGHSGVLYLISPLAMPVVLIMWYAAIKGFQFGRRAKSSGEISGWYPQAGFYIAIVNFVVLGIITIILPIITWVGTGYSTGIP